MISSNNRFVKGYPMAPRDVSVDDSVLPIPGFIPREEEEQIIANTLNALCREGALAPFVSNFVSAAIERRVTFHNACARIEKELDLYIDEARSMLHIRRMVKAARQTREHVAEKERDLMRLLSSAQRDVYWVSTVRLSFGIAAYDPSLQV